MQDLYLSSTDSVEDNILAIINFVKEVEKEHGLTEKEIEFKYTNGHCRTLTSIVIDTLFRCFGYTEGFGVERASGGCLHFYVVRETKRGKKFYYDILGKKTFEEMRAFMQSDYWDKDPDSQVVSTLFTTDHCKADYVMDECYNHIKAKSLNV